MRYREKDRDAHYTLKIGEIPTISTNSDGEEVPSKHIPNGEELPTK